jgi:hypothetical protein
LALVEGLEAPGTAFVRGTVDLRFEYEYRPAG